MSFAICARAVRGSTPRGVLRIRGVPRGERCSPHTVPAFGSVLLESNHSIIDLFVHGHAASSVRRFSSVPQRRSPRPNQWHFPYVKLRDNDTTNGDTFRVLELLQGRVKDPLSCRLRHVSMSTAPKYETMSYRWGSRTDVETIECDSNALKIPAALALALRSMRYPDRSRTLWADAACINQEDLREKEQQVQLMRDIYSRSQRTLIWLGDEPELKMSWAARIAIFSALAFFKRRVKDSDIPKMHFYDYRRGTHASVSPLSAQGYIAFVNMLRNPWFQRAWVVQEVAVSKNPSVIWNGHEIPWVDIVQCLEFLSRMDFGLAFIPTLQHVASIESERQRYQDDKGDLLGILQRHQRCEATDERDKIFAFAGLTANLPHGFTIDYAKPAESIYIEVARDILRSEKSLSLLSQPASMESRGFALPSWVPDWSRVRAVKMSHSWGLEALALSRKMPFPGDESCLKFMAASKTIDQLQFANNGLGLQLEGYTFDTVTEVGDIFEGIEMPPPVTGIRGIIQGWIHTSRTYVKAQRVLMGWEAMAAARIPKKIYEPTGEPLLDAYWKTVSAGDYPHTEGVRFEVKIWNHVNKLAWKLRKYKSERFLLLPYSVLLSIWQAVSKGPAFKFHIQGHYTLYRRLGRTKSGCLALVGPQTKVGDAIVLCKGSNIPLIVRLDKNATKCKLVGDAYVHGIMFGEGWDESR